MAKFLEEKTIYQSPELELLILQDAVFTELSKEDPYVDDSYGDGLNWGA